MVLPPNWGETLIRWQGFVGTVKRSEVIPVPGLVTQPLRSLVALTYRGKPFSTLPIEISSPEGQSVVNVDRVEVSALSEIGLPATEAVPCLSLRYQMAQRLHACTATPADGRSNDRAHDLADLILIRDLAGSEFDVGEAQDACVEIFDLRAQQVWPPALVVPDYWRVIVVLFGWWRWLLAEV